MTATRANSGLLDTLHALSATIVRGAQTRLELAALDIESERDALLRRMALLLMALFFGAFGLLIGVVWLVMLVAETWRVAALGGAALGFVLAAGLAYLVMRADIKRNSGFMSNTLDVLRDDAQALASASGMKSTIGARTTP